MRKTYIIIFVILLSIVDVTIFGQTISDTVKTINSKHKYALGIGIGYTTGAGVSFRFTPNKFGIQTNLFTRYDETRIDFGIGLTFLYTLIEAERTSFYLYQGNFYFYSDYHPDAHLDYNHIIKGFNNGVGFGVEFIILKQVGFHLMTGYAFYDNFERFRITGETGLYYKF